MAADEELFEILRKQYETHLGNSSLKDFQALSDSRLEKFLDKFVHHFGHASQFSRLHQTSRSSGTFSTLSRSLSVCMFVFVAPHSHHNTSPPLTTQTTTTTTLLFCSPRITTIRSSVRPPPARRDHHHPPLLVIHVCDFVFHDRRPRPPQKSMIDPRLSLSLSKTQHK
jgi:hypothetical protein